MESTSEPQYKKNLPNAVADRHETHNMWQIGLSSPTIRGFSPGQIRTRLNRISFGRRVRQSLHSPAEENLVCASVVHFGGYPGIEEEAMSQERENQPDTYLSNGG